MSTLLEIDLRFILFMGTLTMLTLGLAIIFFVVMYQRKILRKNLVIQEIEDTLKEKELDSVYAIVDAQVKERKRIAKELHDNVGSVLATLKMYADTLSEKGQEEQLSLAQEISRITEKAGVETRRLSHSLNEGVSDHFSFKSSLIELITTVNNLGKIELKASGDLESVPNDDKGLQLFRIVQELISNTVKHARAKSAEIELTLINGVMNLLYSDDGVGFDVQKGRRGIGLANIRSRLENISGEMEVESEMGKGTTFSIDINIL
jgi:signal transduction histidine kinase